MTRIFGVSGASGSGKTTLITRLVPLFQQAGLTVSTVKQAHAGFDPDQPGKDSWRHREAGAAEVMVVSARRWALMGALAPDAPPSMPAMLARLAPVDWVLIEGFREWPHPRIEVHRPALGKPPRWPDDPHVVAVASDQPLSGVPVPVLALDDAPAIARFILDMETR